MSDLTYVECDIRLIGWMKTNPSFGCTATSKRRRFRWKLELKPARYCDDSKAENASGYPQSADAVNRDAVP